MMKHLIGVAALVTTFCFATATLAVGSPRITVTGKVVDSDGKPLSNATVMVYHAGVKVGYSTFCPSCYEDCGKRTRTDAAGFYTFTKLNSDLWFELLIVRDRYTPAFVKVTDSTNGMAPTAVLTLRPPITDPATEVKGRVIDAAGNAVPDAVVNSVGVETDKGSSIGTGLLGLGTIPGLDPLAVTDQNGDFELLYEKPAKRMLVTVEARTLALKFETLATGPQRQTIELQKGAAVKGRLVQDGKPVADAEIGLIGQKQGGWGPALTIVGDPYPEMRVGTQQDGTFMISDVPTGVEWFVFAKMESVDTKGASEPKACITTRPNEMVDVGEISLHTGYRLEGQVVLSDGKSVPDGMRVIITSQRVWDSQIVLLDKDGRFKFLGLPQGNYWIIPSVRGYSLPVGQHEVETSVERNVDDFVISLNPTPPAR
jgi:intradiol ring-cleaving dioxygenase-like protein